MTQAVAWDFSLRRRSPFSSFTVFCISAAGGMTRTSSESACSEGSTLSSISGDSNARARAAKSRRAPVATGRRRAARLAAESPDTPPESGTIPHSHLARRPRRRSFLEQSLSDRRDTDPDAGAELLPRRTGEVTGGCGWSHPEASATTPRTTSVADGSERSMEPNRPPVPDSAIPIVIPRSRRASSRTCASERSSSA